MDFDAAFAQHHAPLFRYLHRLLGDADAAADLTQEAFVRLLENPLPDDEVRPWLFTVATNLARDLARARSRRRRLLQEEGESEGVVPHRPPGPDEETARRRRIEQVRAALDRLSERDREILLMREEGFRYAEIADVIGVASTSVGTLLARALRRFQAAYEETAGAAGRTTDEEG